MTNKAYLEILRRAEQDLQFSRETINKNMSQQPAMYFYYANLYNMLSRQSKKLKIKLGEIESRVYKELQEGRDRITERMHLTWIYQDKQWLVVKREQEEMESQADGLDKICRAFEHRRDMLVNISATMRAEMNSEISIRKSI